MQRGQTGRGFHSGKDLSAASRVEAVVQQFDLGRHPPIRRISGSHAAIRKCAGGAAGLWVPPLTLAVLGPSANHSAGSTVCNTRG